MDSTMKSDLQRAYDIFSGVRDRSPIQPWKVPERDRFLAAIRDEGKKSLLEIGAGTGRDCLFFQQNGFTVSCIDLSEEMAAKCREKGLDARQMDFYRLQFADNSFDSVYAMNCLLHVPKADLAGVLLEIRRVLKPEGLFFLGVYGGKSSEGIWENDHYEPKRFFSMFEDGDIAEAVGRIFQVVDFHTVPIKEDSPHFQSLLLRKEKGESRQC